MDSPPYKKVPKLGRKNNEKTCKIRKSVLWLHLLRVKINPPYAREKEMVFFLFQKPQEQPDPAVIFKDFCRTVIPGETVSEPCTKT